MKRRSYFEQQSVIWALIKRLQTYRKLTRGDMHEVHLRPCLRRVSPRVVKVLEPSDLKPDWAMLASKLMLLLGRPKPLLGGVGALVFICSVTALAVTASQPYPELPEIFPKVHHREAGRPLLQSFRHVHPAQEEAPFTIRMCEPGRNLSSSAAQRVQ
eukprot:Skav216643  [mRNA]  locus=scaffold1255:206781:216072:+ [translate_table: standard]